MVEIDIVVIDQAVKIQEAEFRMACEEAASKSLTSTNTYTKILDYYQWFLFLVLAKSGISLLMFDIAVMRLTNNRSLQTIRNSLLLELERGLL
ncbi:MAG: hypothetical protein WC340_02145 [Kiritimatiellia bacterium]